MSSTDREEISLYKPRMKPNTFERLNGKRTVLISLSFFTVLLAWSYFNFKVPRILDDLLGNMTNLYAKQTVKGIIAGVSVLICWNILGFLFARHQFNKYVLEQ